MTTTAAIGLPDGTFRAHFTEDGLAGLDWPERVASPVASPTLTPSQRDWLELTRAALSDALAGVTPRRLPPLDLSRGTAFQRAVWQALLQIPAGETRSYGALAAAVGRPGAARAVGQACGANPVPVLIPCHRVLAAHGGPGGFSGPMHWKQELLRREGSRLQSLFEIAR
ncbi:MAG: methylated-DNA--[protein]-cysteine S-methyltransferase [Verrucomicrobia bacterium]|nr:methylated-DNA--[protein]-cysteine S-methyltransferase [Verrucomicrobiota bacterium]